MRLSGRDRLIILMSAVLLVLSLVVGFCLQNMAGGTRGGLPAVNELVFARTAPGTTVLEPQVKLDPKAPFRTGGKAEPNDAQLTLYSKTGSAYAIYELGRFVAGDKLDQVVLNGNWTDTHDLGYRIALADFATGEWNLTEPITQGKERTIELPDTAEPFSHAGYAYLAVVTEESTALAIKGLSVICTLHYGDAVEIHADLLKQEAIHVPVAIPLTAVDANGRIAKGYNANILIEAVSDGAKEIASADFVDGQARPVHVFEKAGHYQINFFDTETDFTGKLGELELYESQLPVYSLEINDYALNELEKDPKSNIFQEAGISVGQGAKMQALIRYRGNSRRLQEKRCYKVKLNGDLKFDDAEWGYKRDCLNLIADQSDNTMLREKLCYDMMRELGVPTPRARLVHLRINDVYQGVYLDVEAPRKDWLKEMGLDNDGVLYEPQIRGALEYYPNASEYALYWQKETRSNEPYTDLQRFCSKLLELSKADAQTAHDALHKLVDMGSYYRFIAVLRCVSSIENFDINFNLYNDDQGSGKWLLLPWDMDRTWGYSSAPEIPVDLPPDYKSDATLMTRLVYGNPLLKQELDATISAVLRNCFGEGYLLGHIDELSAKVLPDVLADYHMQCKTPQEYDAYIQGMKDFVRGRCGFIMAQLGLEEGQPLALVQGQEDESEKSGA